MSNVERMTGAVRGIRGRRSRGFEKATFSLEPRHISIVRDEAERRKADRQTTQPDASEVVREAIELWAMLRSVDNMKKQILEQGRRALDLTKKAAAGARTRSDVEAAERFARRRERLEEVLLRALGYVDEQKRTPPQVRERTEPALLGFIAELAGVCSFASGDALAYLSAIRAGKGGTP